MRFLFEKFKKLTKFILIVLAGVLVAGCGSKVDKVAPAPPAPDARDVELKIAIELAGEYLVDVCGPDGRFIYARNISDGAESSRYNMLRHLGTVYSLCEYYKFSPSKSTMDAIERAVKYFRENSLGPVEGYDDMLAVWSTPEIHGRSAKAHPTSAKLGGAGLALVALTTLEEINPGTTPHQDLIKIANFIIFMQKENWGFYSRYTPSKGGKDDSWISLYYPGEAAFGLKKLYTLTGYKPAIISAQKALMYLAATREGQFPLPPDHWALIATAWENKKPFDISDPITLHAMMVAKSIVREIPKDIPAGSPIHGCFNSRGLTCPTSARSEGLVAMLKILPPDHAFATELSQILDDSIAFLIRSQVRIGKYVGAIPRAVTFIGGESPPRADEVRIDYVQHAMCAMIEYSALRRR